MTTPPPRTQTIRFARPTNGPAKPYEPPKPRQLQDTTILKDPLRKFSKGPWCPSFSVAFRVLLLMRFAAAVYSNISDCDEVYNFWEPLHYLDQGSGFQTWETSPSYAIRSWAYISLHLIPARLPRLLNMNKRQSFFFVRMIIGSASAASEARFYRSIVENVNTHVGRYTLFFLLLSAGMWSSSTAFLPSSFAMISNMVALSYAFELPSRLNNSRTLLATVFFALGAIVGWPFSLAIAIPFVIEELFVYGQDKIKPEARTSWLVSRWTRLIQSGLVASLILIPVVAIDSVAYGKLTVTPWNILQYNVFNSDPTRGPALYGTEPWYFYISNLILNFNILTPIAIVAAPALVVTHLVESKRLGPKTGPESSSPYTELALRLAPLYLWLGIMSLQPHKEERFMYPAYPLLCFNAAVTLYLVRGWMEAAYIKATNSPYQATRTRIFSLFTFVVVLLASAFSILRILALGHYYHAPLDIVFHLQNTELPRLLNVTNLIAAKKLSYDPNGTGPISTSIYDDDVEVDLAPLVTFGGLTLCLGREWYRFPSHYLVPDGVNVHFIKSAFDGMLPGHFADDASRNASSLWKRGGTRQAAFGLNDKNVEEPSYYVPIDSCDYLIDSYFPLRKDEISHVPEKDVWDTVFCKDFLDATNSGQFSRLMWLPGETWKANGLGFDGGLKYGDYCVLRHHARATERENKIWTSAASL